MPRHSAHRNEERLGANGAVDEASADRDAVKNSVRPDETNLVFFGEPGRDGQRRGYDFKPAWFDAVKAAGLKDFRFHDLRHEAVSRLVEAGLSDQETASISGQSMQMLRAIRTSEGGGSRETARSGRNSLETMNLCAEYDFR